MCHSFPNTAQWHKKTIKIPLPMDISHSGDSLGVRLTAKKDEEKKTRSSTFRRFHQQSSNLAAQFPLLLCNKVGCSAKTAKIDEEKKDEEFDVQTISPAPFSCAEFKLGCSLPIGKPSFISDTGWEQSSWRKSG